MEFLPKSEILTLEELERLCSAFVEKGVERLRITGGEPLVRKNVMRLFEKSGRAGSARENCRSSPSPPTAAGLPHYARGLRDAGVRRVNVSLDSLRPGLIPDHHPLAANLAKVIAGIDAALAAGLEVKINTVALKGVNDDEMPEIMRWAHQRGMDFTLIETMPMGETEEDRLDAISATVAGAREFGEAISRSPLAPIAPAGRPAMSRSPKPAGVWA